MTELRFKVAPVWKGNYNENITYDISDEVSFTSDMVEEITENTSTFGHYRSLIKNNTSPLNDTSAWSLILDLSRIETATREGEEINKILKSNEAIRVDNENNRIEQENIRKNSELQRAINENNRKSAETNRIDAEANRKSSENSRKDNEISRNFAENQRINAENTRILNEDTRQSNETTRNNNETSRISSENTRKTNENTRISNELTRQQNETTRLLQEGSSSDSPNPTGSRWARYKLAESDRDTVFNNSQQNRADTFIQSQTDRQTSYNQAEGTPEDEPDAGGSRWARYLKAESDRDVAILEIKEDYAKKEDLENGNIVPAMAETLAPWADQKAIATPDTYTDAVRTTGGDIPIETSAGSKLESIKPVAGSKWTAKMLFNGSYNMLNAAKWGAANSQPYVGGVGNDFVYFLVPELTLGTFGTADENNGLLFTNAQGENVQPTSVYFKPLGATVPQSLTDGTSVSPTSVNYDGNVYKTYETSGAGWLIIPKTYYDNDVCAHIAWEDWYDKHVSLDEPNTNPEAVVGALMLEGLLALAHSDKYLRGVNDEVCDKVVFGDTSATVTHMVDELSVAANSWTNAATGESDSHGNALYRHSATVSGIKQGGAACIEGEDGGTPLTVNGTTVSYIDTNAAAPASVVFYQIPTTETIEKAYTDSVFSGSNINTETGVLPINDCSIEAQVAMDGEANITVKYAKNIVDQVAINATVDVPQIKRQVEDHEERIEELEETAVRTGSYDASVSVGLADNLRGDTVVNAEFYKRKTGGTQSVGSGIAAIKEVRGKSIVWNQLVTNGNFSNGTTGWSPSSSSISASNGIATILATNINGRMIKNIDVIPGHKYVMICVVRTDASSSNKFCHVSGSGITYDIGQMDMTTTNWQVVAVKFTADNTATTAQLRICRDTADSDWVNSYCKAVNVIDLTLMFGANNEPATVADFEKMFPLDYYDYNAGEVIPFAGQNLVTTGKNQYNPATGKANLLGGQTYQIGGTYTGATIDEVAVTLDSNNCFTTTKDCVLDVTGGNDTDTFVGLYNGENVAYEPYEKHTLPLDPSQWRDKQGNLVFPYGGMHGVGTAYDYAKVDADGYIRGVVRVFGSVDLGNCDDWTFTTHQGSGNSYFSSRTLMSLANKSQGGGRVCNALCSLYTPVPGNDAKYTANLDKVFAIDGNADINIIDANLSSTDIVNGIIAKLNGVMLIYELAEPVEVELATPVYAKYLVDKDGTEEITPANGATPYTTSANLSILYAMDARGEIKNLPKNYLSKESAENMLNAMVSAGVIASYTMTWDAANNRYAFVITAPVEPEPAQSNN